MKKIIYIYILTVLSNNGMAAAAEDQEQKGGLFSTVRSFFKAPTVKEDSSKVENRRIDLSRPPRTLEEAVSNWRICRANALGVIEFSGRIPSIYEFYVAERLAASFINSKIEEGLPAEKITWLKMEIFGTDIRKGTKDFTQLF